MDKAILVNIVLLIHMALTGIMLFRLFKFKSVTGGQLILTFVALIIPVLGPSGLIYYYNHLAKKQQAEAEKRKKPTKPNFNNKNKRK